MDPWKKELDELMRASESTQSDASERTKLAFNKMNAFFKQTVAPALTDLRERLPAHFHKPPLTVKSWTAWIFIFSDDTGESLSYQIYDSTQGPIVQLRSKMERRYAYSKPIHTYHLFGRWPLERAYERITRDIIMRDFIS